MLLKIADFVCRCFVLFAVCLVFAGLPASADTIYVNNLGGSDSNNGATTSNKGDNVGPLQTIEAALRRVKRGDSIELANTDIPYKECVALQGRRHSGTSFAPFVIEGNGATLDGIAEVPPHRWEHVTGDVFRFAPDRAGYQQLFLNGEAAKLVGRFDGFYNTSFLEEGQWCRCKGGIHFGTAKDRSVHNYDLSYASHPVGITLYEVEHVVIRDLTLRGFQLDGLNAHDNAFDCVLSKVTSIENGRSGVSVGGSSRVRLVDCVLEKNNDTQLNAEGWSTATLKDTTLSSKEASLWKRELNSFGRGARIVIDGETQFEQQGWSDEDDEEKDSEDAEAEDADADDKTEIGQPGDSEAEAEDGRDEETEDNDLNSIFDGLDDQDETQDSEADDAAVELEATNDDPFADFDETDESPTEAVDESGDLFDDNGADDLFEDTDAADEDDPFGE